MRGSTNITLAAAQERSGDIVEVDRAICGDRCGVGLHLPAPVEPTKKNFALLLQGEDFPGYYTSTRIRA